MSNTNEDRKLLEDSDHATFDSSTAGLVSDEDTEVVQAAEGFEESLVGIANVLDQPFTADPYIKVASMLLGISVAAVLGDLFYVLRRIGKIVFINLRGVTPPNSTEHIVRTLLLDVEIASAYTSEELTEKLTAYRELQGL